MEEAMSRAIISGFSGKFEDSVNSDVAIVGAGPAGLSCAYFLARMGYQPKVYESEPRPGGMLVSGIPSFRLPREVLGKEIDALVAHRVDVIGRPPPDGAQGLVGSDGHVLPLGRIVKLRCAVLAHGHDFATRRNP